MKSLEFNYRWSNLGKTNGHILNWEREWILSLKQVAPASHRPSHLRPTWLQPMGWATKLKSLHNSSVINLLTWHIEASVSQPINAPVYPESLSSQSFPLHAHSHYYGPLLMPRLVISYTWTGSRTAQGPDPAHSLRVDRVSPGQIYLFCFSAAMVFPQCRVE